jgi:hypothetical protein
MISFRYDLNGCFKAVTFIVTGSSHFNDANGSGIETMGTHYPLELFMRVVTVNLETMKIVNGLPPLEIAGN